MRVSVSSGGNGDFLELQAETIRECCELMRSYTSQFVDTSNFHLNLSCETIIVRIWLSAYRGKHISAETKADIDATP